MIYVEQLEDENGDLVDIFYYCSSFCYETETGKPAYGHGWLYGPETDYDVHCQNCGELLWEGLQLDESRSK